MTITFLVGNGFDRSCNINTSFDHFCNWYIRQESNSTVIKAFKDDIDTDQKNKTGYWSDFEIALGRYSDKVDSAEDFIELFEDVHDSIVNYLRLESSRFSQELSPSIDLNEARGGLLHFYHELNSAERKVLDSVCDKDKIPDIRFKFITFNYTSFIDNCVKKLSEAPLYMSHRVTGVVKRVVDPQVLHVHGYLDLFPILGVNDESQFLNKKLLDHYGIYASVIKDQSDVEAGEEWISSANAIIEESSVICIWGMSLGASDANWWRKIMNWLKANENNHLVVYQHSKEGKNTISFLKKVEGKRNLIDYMIKVSGLESSQFEGIQNRIHIIHNTESVLRVSFDTIQNSTD